MMKPEPTSRAPTPATTPTTPAPSSGAKTPPGAILNGTGSLVIEHQQPQVPPPDSTVSKVIGAGNPVSVSPQTPGSVIASDMMFEGTASLEPTALPLIVHGRVDGSINGTPAVTIAPGGEVNGNIAQPTVLTIEGNYKGDATADQVKIGEQANTAGTIAYKKIIILGGDNEIQLKPIRPTANE